MFSLIPWRKGKNEKALERLMEQPLEMFRKDFETLFDRFFGRVGEPLGLTTWPQWSEFERGWGMEVKEKEKEMVVEVEAPGFEPGEIDIRIGDGTLEIKAEHCEKAEEKGTAGERRLHRYLTLPVGVEAEKVEARYHNGLLELHFPKTEKAEGRKIEVKSE